MATWRWSPKRLKAAELIAKGEFTQQQIAAQCGVSDRAIRKWLSAPEFDAYVSQLEAAIMLEAARYLHRHALAAAQRVVEIAKGGALTDKVRLQASLEVLNRSGVIAVKGQEIEVKGQPLIAILPAVEAAEGAADAAVDAP